MVAKKLKRRNNMRDENISSIVINYSDKLLPDDIPRLENALRNSDGSRTSALLSCKIYNPIVALVLSIFLGTLGIDRFYIGDVGKGILKLLLTVVIIPALYILFVALAMVSLADGVAQSAGGTLEGGENILIYSILIIAIALLETIIYFMELYFCQKKAKRKNIENLLDALR